MRRQVRLPLVRFSAVVVALFALTALVLAAVPVAAQSNQSITIVLKEENNSGVSGTALLTAEGNQTKVELQVKNPDGGRPAGIFQGTCENLNPEATYPLQTVQSNGKSVTTISTTLTALQSGQFVVNLRQSSSQLGVYVACGAIPGISAALPSPPQSAAAAATTTATATPSPTATPTPSPTATPTPVPTATPTPAPTATPTQPVAVQFPAAPVVTTPTQLPVAAGGLLAVNTPPTTGAGVTALQSASPALLAAAGALALLCVGAGLMLRRRAV